MKILFLTTHLNAGGITSYLLTLAKEFARRGEKVYIGASDGDQEDRFTACGAAHVRLRIKTKSELDPRLFLAVRQLAGVVRDGGIDVIHSQTRVTQVMGYWLSRLTGRPHISTCHGFFKPRLGRRLFPGWGEKVIAISPAVKAHLQKDFAVEEGRIALIRNGLDVGEYPPLSAVEREAGRQRLGIGAGPLIGIIARLSDVKGHADLLRAMPAVLQRIPAARLCIVGQGREEAPLRRLVGELNLTGQVLFLPVVDRTRELLPLFGVFVMPSLQEGLGLAVMEAQAAGLAVVATSVGGLVNLIEDGRTGLLVPPRDPAALARAIVTVLSDQGLAARLGREAREFISREYSAKTMAQRTLAVYESVMAG